MVHNEKSLAQSSGYLATDKGISPTNYESAPTTIEDLAQKNQTATSLSGKQPNS